MARKIWINGETPVNAVNMNNIENRIEQNLNDIGVVSEIIANHIKAHPTFDATEIINKLNLKFDGVELVGNKLTFKSNGIEKISIILPKNNEVIETHNHSNKTVLDGITSNNISEWNNKSTFSGSYNDLTNKPDARISKLEENSNTFNSEILSLKNKIKELEGAIDEILNPPLPNFLGLIGFKELTSITYSDLQGLESSDVVKPQTIYSHSTGTVGNKALVIAFPSTFGTLSSVVDQAGVNLTNNTYEYTTKTFSINGKNIDYVICATNEASAFTNSVVIKFNII